MAFRIYLPSSGSAPVTPSTWNHANQAPTTYTLPGKNTKASPTALTSRTTASGTTNPYTRAVMRYIIGPLAPNEISGTVKAVMRCSEANAACNATMSIAAKIIKPDGTDRSVLLAAIAADRKDNVEEFSTSLYGRLVYNASEVAPIPITARTPTAGDYLVIELGFRSASTTSYNVVMRHGDNSATDMVYEVGSNTNDYAPWVEFSGNTPWQTLQVLKDSTGAVISDPITVSESISIAVGLKISRSDAVDITEYTPTIKVEAEPVSVSVFDVADIIETIPTIELEAIDILVSVLDSIVALDTVTILIIEAPLSINVMEQRPKLIQIIG